MTLVEDSQLVSLEALLDSATGALSNLDAQGSEDILQLVNSLAESGTVLLPDSTAGWARVRSQRWVLEHLLSSTARRLTALRRIATPQSEFTAFGAALYTENHLQLRQCMSPRSDRSTSTP